jgi:putative transposase
VGIHSNRFNAIKRIPLLSLAHEEHSFYFSFLQEICNLSNSNLIENMAMKYKDRSLRMKNYDYGANGKFHITICTHEMKKYFGEVLEAKRFDLEMAGRTGYCPSSNRPALLNNGTGNSPFVLLSAIGQKAKEFWQQIPLHYPYVELDDFIFMPNHMHGILCINKPWKEKWEPNIFGIQSGNLGAIVRGYKSSLKRHANENGIEFKWKERFHDDLIRDSSDLERIRNYIQNNPQKWIEKYGNK